MIWQLVTAGNLLTALTYTAIAGGMGLSLYRTGQFSPGKNPLGVALTVVLAIVALRSAWTAGQMLLPLVGAEHPAALARRDSYTAWSVPLPFIAAAAGAVYLWLRQRAGDEPGPASPYPDQALRRRRALEINDNIVQGLIGARELQALGHDEAAQLALQRTLEQAQRMMGELLEDSGRGEIRPGDLRRTLASVERALPV
jgi:hypothetical protein